MAMPELLQWVQYGRKTGTAIFERRGVIKKVFLEEGELISASSNDPREYLGQILICFNLLTEEQLNQAFQLQKQSKKLLGKVLAQEFGIKEEQILNSLRIKIEETVYNLFLWEEGKFIYSEGLLGLSENDRLKAAIPVEHVIFEGARRVDEWREFRKNFPTDDVVFVRLLEQSNFGDLTKDPIVQKILPEIDGRKSLQRILADTHAPEYRGYEAFGKLFLGGFIQALKSAPKAKAAPKKDEGEVDLKKAADLFKAKHFEEANKIIEAFVLAHPEHQEAQTLSRAVQESLLKSLYASCPPQSIPMLSRDFSELNEQIFSSQEGYLASRINGEWDVKSLIMISPLGELNSLRILKRLHDEGMIRFK